MTRCWEGQADGACARLRKTGAWAPLQHPRSARGLGKHLPSRWKQGSEPGTLAQANQAAASAATTQESAEHQERSIKASSNHNI